MSDQPTKRDRSSPFSQESSFGDIDSFLDFGDNSFLTSPAVNPSTLQRPSFSTSSPSSAQSTPSTTSEFPAPSHPYGLHLQQTDVLGLDIGENFFGENQAFMQLDSDSSTPTHSANSSLPPYFYPEQPATTTAETMSQGISPLMTIGELDSAPVKMETSPPAPTVIRPQPQRMNYYPGYHQEMYNENMRALQAQKLARQKAAAAAPPRAAPHPQQEKIDALLDSFRSTGSPTTLNKSQNDLLPHIARMKKEEDEMDEDERLLASEEGKKLSSKERRQLRNKVSARAFRSRRKEYISQLEAEVAKKTQEAELAKDSARRLEEENARLRGFSEMLMKHAAFQEFLKDITAPLTNPQSIPQPQPRTVAPTAVEPIPTFNPSRDHNPNTTTEEQWPLAYNNWNNTSHVYSVEVPEFPAIQDLDGKMTFEEDYTITDGFFSRIRDEKASIQFDRMDEEEEEEMYQPPENIEDLYSEVESEKEKNLDELFPGVGVNSLLERLELIAGGSARPEDLFDIQQEEVPAVTESSPRIESETCRESNRMLEAAEGVYRRIGLAVGGQ
ncbi:hypothetical protein K440DRAFT_658669 [Wilcoxina mikolae CBS 423.85]|nr:hypothetical protein K440DRAFT_658669 [Wilcoxina mikolae CBS 423.85]